LVEPESVGWPGASLRIVSDDAARIPAELAGIFLDYKRIGVTQFIIAGWPKLDEMLIFGREVLPLVRELEARAAS